jgi:hypothetical protein
MMMPPIPERLHRLDPITRRDHSLLSASDCCYFLWEYAPRQPAGECPGTQLIRDLKIPPTALGLRSSRRRFKRRAIAHAARALRRLLPREWPEESVSLIPMPCSKASGACDHDDRIHAVLRRAFAGREVQVRALLRTTRSVTADHLRGTRSSRAELREVLQVRDDGGPALRSTVVIVDDVLNSGKHFKVAQQLLLARYGVRDIRGLFLARCIRNRG